LSDAVYTGQFQHNQMHGSGVYKWSDGQRFSIGMYLNDKKEGPGIYRFKDSRIWVGHWKAGLQHDRQGMQLVPEPSCGYIVYGGHWSEGMQVGDRWVQSPEETTSIIDEV
jgi:hypothetical protein